MKSLLVKGVKAVGGFAKEEILSAIDDHRVKSLIKKTQSPYFSERTLAKAKLKEFYPEVHSIIEDKMLE